jgi:hypothetical protein
MSESLDTCWSWTSSNTPDSRQETICLRNVLVTKVESCFNPALSTLLFAFSVQ